MATASKTTLPCNPKPANPAFTPTEVWVTTSPMAFVHALVELAPPPAPLFRTICGATRNSSLGWTKPEKHRWGDIHPAVRCKRCHTSIRLHRQRAIRKYMDGLAQASAHKRRNALLRLASHDSTPSAQRPTQQSGSSHP